MRRFSRLLLSIGLLTSPLMAVDVDAPDKEEQIDFQALRDWINTKRQVTVKERGGNLSISGEVRTEYQKINEKKDGIRQRGSGGAVSGKADNAFDVEVNLLLDYRTDRTWAAIKLEFDNDAGTSSGTFNKIALERAVLGGRVVNADTFTIDLEVGRRNLGYVFDSRVQFAAFMDGILFKYDQAWERIGDFFIHGGPFLIDERENHFGYVFEIALLNVYRTGLYVKYSFIDWNTKDFANKIEERRFSFMNSQLVLGYKFIPSKLNKVTTIYSGFLCNHVPSRTPLTKKQKENIAWYVGFSIGEIRKKGDWSLDANHQWVQAQAVPSFDSSGIGRGNVANAGFYSIKNDGSGGSTTRKMAVGSGNFRGFTIDLNYLITNNITLYQNYKQSWTLDTDIGPNLRLKQYEVELIYAF